MNVTKRDLLTATALVSLATIPGTRFIKANAASMPEKFEIIKTDAEWKAQLSPEAYNVLRHEGTEAPFTSPLNEEHRKGTFECAGCALPLFSSTTKFDSGTGWPSFYEPLKNAVIETSNTTFMMTRTAVSCRRCGGHLGHVFEDGPKPTGLRYCMNGVAMAFVEGV